MKNPRVSRRKEIFKSRAEIKAKETKETIAKVNKGNTWFFEKISQTHPETKEEKSNQQNQK